MNIATDHPLAQLITKRYGVDDSVLLFEDRIDVRWKRHTQSGEASIPLAMMSGSFHRTDRAAHNVVVLVGFMIALVALATAGGLTLPDRYNTFVAVCCGVCAGVFGGYAIYDLRARHSHWNFMNAQYGAVIYAHRARPNEIPEAEAFIAKLINQIQAVHNKGSDSTGS